MKRNQKRVYPESYKDRKESYSLEDAFYQDGTIVKGLKILCWKVLSRKEASGHKSLLKIAEELLNKTPNTLKKTYFPRYTCPLLEIEETPESMQNSPILVFVNGIEPSNGTKSLDKVYPKPRDLVMICCPKKDYFESE